MSFLSAGVVTGVLALAAAGANAAGYPLAGAFLSDPATATSVTMVMTGLGALVAGGLAGVRKHAA